MLNLIFNQNLEMVLCCCSIKPITVWIYLFLCINMFHISNELEPKIDPQHKLKYPNCGIKPQRIRKHGGNRISNSVLSKDRYPWVIKVVRTVRTTSTGTKWDCGGTIVSNT